MGLLPLLLVHVFQIYNWSSSHRLFTVFSILGLYVLQKGKHVLWQRGREYTEFGSGSVQQKVRATIYTIFLEWPGLLNIIWLGILVPFGRPMISMFLYFWWLLPWVSDPEWITSLRTLSPAQDRSRFLRSPLGATPAKLLTTGISYLSRCHLVLSSNKVKPSSNSDVLMLVPLA